MRSSIAIITFLVVIIVCWFNSPTIADPGKKP